MRELEEEKRQRRNFEKASLVLLFLSLVLLAVVAAGSLRFGAVSSERDSEQARAQSNGTAAKGLAARVKQVCTQGGQESVRLHRSGLCVDAVRVERSVQGVPGPTGERGPQGSPGLNGVKGPDGLPGANGKDGHDGVPGRAGVDGVAGVDGKDGANGADGERGDVGPSGPAGPQGAQGERGERGHAGANGKDGKDGKDGRSVVSVYCSEGRLVVKYSDGVASTISGSVACQGVRPPPIVTISSHK